MCSHYEAPLRQLLQSAFPAAALPGPWDKPDMWPGYLGPFIRRPPEIGSGDDAVPPLQVEIGVFGLLPHWARDQKLARSTYNVKSETADTKPAYRDAWRRARHCIIPAPAIYEPDHRGPGRPVPTRISRTDGELMGIAGLWDRWRDETGREVLSYSMLTINADHHELMRNFHRPEDEKRMVVILPRGLYNAWLDAPAEQSMDFMRMFPANRLNAEARPAPIRS